MTKENLHIDLLIIGAGPVGLFLAQAMAESGQRVALIDRRSQAALSADPRALALSEGSRQMLATLGVWPAHAATPIHSIHVSQRGGLGRTLLEHDDLALEALGYVVRYRDLATTLAQTRHPDCMLLDESEVIGLDLEAEAVRVTLQRPSGHYSLTSRVLVHAEGSPDAGPGIRLHDYQQQAIVTEARPHKAHQNRAWERFTPDGPLALLPLGTAYSVVLTVPPAQADSLMALDTPQFVAALTERFGGQVRLSDCGPRHRFPLALRWREPVVQGREVWIGNTAQTLHPVSGQGLNLGLRDAWELASALRTSPLEPATLLTYAKGRRLDRRGSALFTDGVVRLFSNNSPPLRWARGLGLMGLDVCPPARRFLARRMIWGARAWF